MGELKNAIEQWEDEYNKCKDPVYFYSRYLMIKREDGSTMVPPPLSDKAIYSHKELLDFAEQYHQSKVNNVVLDDVTQQSELLKALKTIEHYCNEHTHEHEYIWHVASDAIKALNGG